MRPRPGVPAVNNTGAGNEPEEDESGATDEPRSVQSPATADVSSDGRKFEASFENEEMTLADELGVEDLTDILFADRGRIFSAAGREAPIAEFGDDGVLLRPPQLPYLDAPASEEIVYLADEYGILLNELGERRKIIGAKFRGQAIYAIAEQKPGTVKHYVAWFDENWTPHKFIVQGEPLTSDMLFRIRNRTHDGEISVFPEIETE